MPPAPRATSRASSFLEEILIEALHLQNPIQANTEAIANQQAARLKGRSGLRSLKLHRILLLTLTSSPVNRLPLGGIQGRRNAGILLQCFRWELVFCR